MDRRKLIIPGVFGNILEWYDFSLYGYFAPIIATLFFPTQDKFLSLFATFGIFAIGFLMRPLGAIIFGHFGDRIGRKKTLATAVILMAIPTTLIGLLPTYQQIGLFAGVLLMICRLLQGLAIGGEFSGSIVYIIEHAPSNRRGLYGSWVMFSAFTGLLLGSGVSALASNLMSAENLQSWGWRIPFIAGLLLGFIGLYLRLRMPETPHFLAVQAEKRVVKNPLLQAFKKAPLPMLLATLLDFLPAMAFYLLFVYLSSYMTIWLKIPLNQALVVNTISMSVIVICIPFFGLLSDKIGRRPVLAGAALCFVILSYPLFLLLQRNSGDILLVLTIQMSFAMLSSLVYAAIPATLSEMMDANIRYTAMSLPYNLANTLFGGTAPLVATFLIAKTGSPSAPSFYLIFAGIVMMIAVAAIKETYNKPLST